MWPCLPELGALILLLPPLPPFRLFYLATSADTLVAGVRDWMDSQAGGGPFGSPQDASSAEAAAAAAAAAAKLAAPIVTGEASRRQLLDRYHQHTVHCHSCM